MKNCLSLSLSLFLSVFNLRTSHLFSLPLFSCSINRAYSSSVGSGHPFFEHVVFAIRGVTCVCCFRLACVFACLNFEKNIASALCYLFRVFCKIQKTYTTSHVILTLCRAAFYTRARASKRERESQRAPESKREREETNGFFLDLTV